MSPKSPIKINPTTKTSMSDPFENRPEVNYFLLPRGEPKELYAKTHIDCQNGSRVEVYSVKDSDGLQFKLRRPLPDDRQSVLVFGLTREAATALMCLLHDKLNHPERHPEYSMNAKDVAAAETTPKNNQTASSPSPRSAC